MAELLSPIAVAAAPETVGEKPLLGTLRHAIARIEGNRIAQEAGFVAVGLPDIDATLAGGLMRGALHEIAARGESEIAAASAFALAMASKHRRAALWIAEDMAFAESGAPYGPGLDELGVAPERCITVAVPCAADVLWAMEEALRCRAVGTVIGEMRDGARADLTLTRRLSLAAARTHALALLLCASPPKTASVAMTRWIVGSAPAAPTAFGTGPPRLAVELTRNRRGPVGSWMVEWNRAEQRFEYAALSQPVAAVSRDRPREAGVAA